MMWASLVTARDGSERWNRLSRLFCLMRESRSQSGMRRKVEKRDFSPLRIGTATPGECLGRIHFTVLLLPRCVILPSIPANIPAENGFGGLVAVGSDADADLIFGPIINLGFSF